MPWLLLGVQVVVRRGFTLFKRADIRGLRGSMAVRCVQVCNETCRTLCGSTYASLPIVLNSRATATTVAARAP